MWGDVTAGKSAELSTLHLYLFSYSSSSVLTADGAFDEIIKILNFPNSPSLSLSQRTGALKYSTQLNSTLNNEDYQMVLQIILKDESQNSLFARPTPSQATCISDAMKILNKNELKILINSHSHSHVAKHK